MSQFPFEIQYPKGFEEPEPTLMAAATRALDRLRLGDDAEGGAITRLPSDNVNLAEIRLQAETWRKTATRLIVIGTGGSAMGARALLELGGEGGQVILMPTLAAGLDEDLLSSVDPTNTHILIVSKSGGTTEVLAQTVLALSSVEASGGRDAVRSCFTFLTEPGDGALRQIAAEFSIPVLDHDPSLGGRFSVLSNVGLLPAAFAGVDIALVRAGARDVLDQAFSAPVDQTPSAVGAAFLVEQEKRGRTINILMPYVARFSALSDWYVQLWSESLGKDGKGSTPVPSLGPRDQHSQLQQFLEGRRDKSVTFIAADVPNTARPIECADLAEGKLSHLHGKSLAAITDALYQGTRESLNAAGVPTRTFLISNAEEFALGGLMMQFMLETYIAAEMLDVDPFGQPGVEHGKRITREILER